MTFEKDGRRYMVRVFAGENVHDSLTALAKRENLKGATFSGLGAVKNVELGYYALGEKKYHFKMYDGIYELVSMNGNIAWVGDGPAVHIHATCSGEDNTVFGGHVNKMISAITVEVALIALDVKLEREVDDASGLKLLKLSHAV